MAKQQAKAEVDTEPIVRTKLSRFVQLGVYDPTNPGQPIKFHSRVFGNKRYDRIAMRQAICSFNRLLAGRPNDHRCIGVFPAQVLSQT